MKVKIDPLDTLVFGRGKPSVWGEDTFGAGMFPPYPSVIRGAARANYLHIHGNYDMADTDLDPTRSFAVTSYALYIDGKPYFRAPADFVLEGEKLRKCELRKNDGLSNLTTEGQLWASAEDKVESAENRYIDLEAIEAYLNGENSQPSSISLGDFIANESRIGIFKNRETGTVRESMLYRTPLMRLENAQHKKVSLVASIDGAENLSGLTRFGGESKVADFKAFEGRIIPHAPEISGDVFKLYLSTPTLLGNGYLPKIPGTSLLAAAVYGYDSVGGFDMKANAPKPMRRAVKAGSVYYYRITDQSKCGQIEAMHGKSISDYCPEDGFGIALIGNVKENAYV
jgi:CRISPR-associated protein Cmr3